MKRMCVTTAVVTVLLAVNLLALAADTPLPEWTPDANVDRPEIPEVYTWDLRPLVADNETWAQRADEAEAMLTALERLRASTDTVSGLASYLKTYFEADELINRITLYANLQRDTHQTDQDIIARHQRALGLTNQLMEEGPVVRRAVLALTAEQISSSPQLAAFRPFLEQLHRRAHAVLGPEAEAVLALAGDNLWAQIDLNELPSASESAFAALMGDLVLPEIIDESGETVRLTFSNYGRFRASEKREVRQGAVAAMFETLKTYENTLAATLAGQAAFDVFLARARGYDTALEAYLDKDNVDPAVYHNLVETVRSRTDLLHRYVTLRKKLLALDSVHLYDLYIPLAQGVDREIPYPEARQIIMTALKPLGPEYGARLATALDPTERWIDLYPSRDKQSGAFSAAAYGVHPYVKMNYQNGYDDMSTLAHELGHTMHSDLAMNAQGPLTWRYPPFLAEIASTCNEMLLSNHMVASAETEKEKAWILSQLTESIRTTIFRQTLFADFELQLHELVEQGRPVTAEALNSIYRNLIEVYYGPDYTIDAGDEVEWAYIPHFYWKYYVYTYATGLTSGIALAERMSHEVPGAVDAYLTMLRAGCSAPPLQSLRDAGVDLTTPKPVNAALDVFERTLDELERLLEP